ncbi:MAG: hypothetical protein IPF92_18650 [Myxococcales bacterium]|nr:hypothetical protein [Myxococcales bacterium]MBL0197220.1 hypothetical protein [Myxococcales bacterium]
MSGPVDSDALYERLAEIASQLVEDPQHTAVIARVLDGPQGTFAEVADLAAPSSMVRIELGRLRRLHGIRLMATHLPCPDGQPNGPTEEPPIGVSMVVFYIPELAAIAETALLDRARIFELTRS